jgi:hypothetical protein
LTIVAAFTGPGWGAMVGDSRITWLGDFPVFQDLVRKIFLLGPLGVIGIAGNTCPATTLVATAQKEVHDKGYYWLLDHNLVGQLVNGVIEYHVKDPGHAQCRQHPVQFIAIFHIPDELAALPKDIDRIMALPHIVEARYEPQSRGTSVIVEDRASGIHFIGRDAPYRNVIGPEHVYSLTEYGGFDKPGLLRRAALAASILYNAGDCLGLKEVGGLLQLWALAPLLGPSVVPYRRYVEVEPGFGTWVEMTIEPDGTWVQSHPPTKTRLPLTPPLPSSIDRRVGTRIFDPSRDLHRDSPGVEPVQASARPLFEVLFPGGPGSLSPQDIFFYNLYLERWRSIEKRRAEGHLDSQHEPSDGN